MRGQKKKYNVVVFFTDQQRWDTMGLHGNPMGLTPNLDRYALEGTHCYNTFTCQPVCLPARASFQSGKYASQVNCDTNGHMLDWKTPTIARHFQAAGYTTGYIGKMHLFHTNFHDQVPEDKEVYGYDYWLGANVPEGCSDDYNAIVYDKEGNEIKLPGYRVDAYADAAIRYIDEHKKEPFFLMTSYLEPHFQNHRDDYPAPYGYYDQYLGKSWMPPDLMKLQGTSASHLPGYYGMIKRLDEAFGRIMDTLKSLGILEDTIVLFTADHGCHFKTRNSEYKRSCHESSIRIPAVLYGGPFTGGGRVKDLVSLIDFPPTLIDACGLDVPDFMMGSSLFGRLFEGADWQDDVFIEISESHTGRAIRTSRWKYSARRIDDSGKYQEEFLYDLYADPYELNNLIAYTSHQEVIQKMRERLTRRMLSVGQNAPVFIPCETIIPGGQKRVSDLEVLA